MYIVSTIMSSLKNDCTKGIITSWDSIAAEICVATGTVNVTELGFEKLNKRNVTKEKVCQWLATICDLFVSAVPVLQSTSTLSDEICKMKDEKIADSGAIIDLQKKLIEKQEELQDKLTVKKEEDLGAVKSVVQSEMKTYSSLLKNTCSNAFAPKKIHAAVKQAKEEEDRSKNLILFGVEELENEDLEATVSVVLEHLNEKPSILDCYRIGKQSVDNDTDRPIKFTLNSSDMARQILRKTKLLKTVDRYDQIYISPDRSPRERVAFKKLIEELKLKRSTESNKIHFIVNNRIVSRDKSEEE